MSTSMADDAEHVSDFLRRIQELGEKRDQEDEERNRKLEEEILQGRKERQARRAERARSISPTKDSPVITPTHDSSQLSHSPRFSRSTLSPAPDLSPTRPERSEQMSRVETAPSPPFKENRTPQSFERDEMDHNMGRSGSIRTSPAAAMPTRTPTLSWQQRRPNSQASERPRSRPLSIIATENAARSPKLTPEPSPETEDNKPASRDQISQMLGSKDPSWFRQTPDRGEKSPAYRKNQVEDSNVIDVVSSSKFQLPGMARSSANISGEGYSGVQVDRSISPSRTSDNSAGKISYSTNTMSSAGMRSPVPLASSQRVSPPPLSDSPDNDVSTRSIAMSPAQGRISPERVNRSPSPTKGMGGFVQSAMMKRSDSVKRWSVQSPQGLGRGNSVTSNRNSLEIGVTPKLGDTLSFEPRPSSLSRESSPLTSSRPGSSHMNKPPALVAEKTISEQSSFKSSFNDDSFVKPNPPRSQANLEATENVSTAAKTPIRDSTPPSSPSKIGDRPRWSPTKSPTKSSWLESALNKPDSPKPNSTPPLVQQPSWMVEMNKAKQKNAEIAKTSSSPPKHEVKLSTGLIRSPPLGGLAKPHNIGGLPAGFSSGTATRSLATASDFGKTPGRHSGDKPELTTSPKPLMPTATLNKPKPEPAMSPKPTSISEFSKPKPITPPKKDFRANLKPKSMPVPGSSPEPEFKNALGQLRRTKTQNYVAPDELKNNILRGKADLNITGGPKKTERKDEFKDAILKKKEDFKKAQAEGTGIKPGSATGIIDSSLPEALAKKAAMGLKPGGIPARDQDPVSAISSEFRKPAAPRASSSTVSSRLLDREKEKEKEKEVTGSKMGGQFNPVLAGILSKRPPSTASTPSEPPKPNSFSPVTLPLRSNISSSRNTAMGGKAEVSSTPAPTGPQLTHMTKSRARGPKRKAPSSAAISGSSNGDGT